LTPDTLLRAIEHLRTKLRELQKSDQKDVSALTELLRRREARPLPISSGLVIRAGNF